MDGEKFQTWNVCSCTANRACFSVNVDDIKMGGKKNNLKPMWDMLIKQVDFKEPTLLLDQAYLVVYAA